MSQICFYIWNLILKNNNNKKKKIFFKKCLLVCWLEQFPRGKLLAVVLFLLDTELGERSVFSDRSSPNR